MNEEQNTTLKEDVAVDIQNLEYEWVRQSSLYMKWSHFLGLAIDEKDRLEAQIERQKRNLDKKRAKLGIYASVNFEVIEDFCGKKPTVGQVSAWVDYQTEIQEMQDEIDKIKEQLNSAKSDISVLQSAQIALVHKKKSLEMLTEMILSGYYSDPNIPKSARDKVKERKTQENVVSHSETITRSVERRKTRLQEIEE